jgi:hypothetical protein
MISKLIVTKVIIFSSEARSFLIIQMKDYDHENNVTCCCSRSFSSSPLTGCDYFTCYRYGNLSRLADGLNDG